MKLRKLQRKNEENVWFDDAYAFEDSKGQTVFCYNLSWGQVGANYNKQILERKVLLEKIETTIPEGEELRWLAIEIVVDENAQIYLDKLNDICCIPKPRPISQPLGATA